MEKLKAGFIGFMPFGASMDETFKVLEKYAAIGYKGVEMGDMFLRNGDPAENLARLKDLGMEPLCTSLPMGKQDLSAVPEIVEKARIKRGSGQRPARSCRSSLPSGRRAGSCIPPRKPG